jgi:hypothetical protein
MSAEPRRLGALPVRGACFGYEVRSSLPLTFLRPGGGSPLEVIAGPQDGPETGDRLLIEWTPLGRHRLHARLYRNLHLYRLWIDGAGWFVIDPTGPRIVVPEDLAPVRREELLWAIPAALCLLYRGDLPLHAATVEVGGGAIILAAPGGYGKTTLAARFYQAGHGVLSEDLTCLQTLPGPAVMAGPAMLRVRPDAAVRLQVDAARPVAATPTRTTLVLVGGRPATAGPVPLRAIVLLRESERALRLRRVAAERAIPDLWALTFQIPGDSDRGRCFNNIVDVARQVPIWNLHRPLRFDALSATMERIIDASSGRG